MKLGIYVHIPYCLQKCNYCDFVSSSVPPNDEYFEWLCREIKLAGEAFGCDAGLTALERSANGRVIADTVYFGGGTPALANREQLASVLDALRLSFEIADDAEISIEINPEIVTKKKAAELIELGFNRISMGIQSLNDEVLEALGRVHSADKAREASRILRSAGFNNINYDLMFGAPEQDLEIWHHTLDEIMTMKPQHISFYSLQIEEGTPLHADYSAGRVNIPSWEENREMYHSALEIIKSKGYRHYEISNAALDGFECRHNLKYWNMEPYMGFGTSAHSFINGCRGEIDFEKLEEELSSGRFDGSFGLERESDGDLKGDFIFTKLRLVDGFDPKGYSEIFASDFLEEFAEPLEQLKAEGLIEYSPKLVKLSKKGLDFTNPVIEKLLECVQ